VNLDPLWNSDEVVLIQALEFPPTQPFRGRDRILANRCDLIDYGKGMSWRKSIWKIYIKQRILDEKKRHGKVLGESDKKASLFYLNRILKASKEKNTVVKEDSDLEIPYEFDDNVAFHGCKDIKDETNVLSEKRSEPLRPGDVIQYCSPIFCAGDPRGRRTAIVISTDPSSRDCMISLDNCEALPNEHLIKRVKVYEQNRQYDHAGYFRPVQQFVMKKRCLGVDFKQILQLKGERFGKIIDSNITKFNTSMKEKGLPMDFVQSFKSTRQLQADRMLCEKLWDPNEPGKIKNSTETDSSDSSLVISAVVRKSSSVKAHFQEASKCSENLYSSDSEDSLDIVLSDQISRRKPQSSHSNIAIDTSTTKAPALKSTKVTKLDVECHESAYHSPPGCSHNDEISQIVAKMIKQSQLSRNVSLHPNIHDESDSDSSMENYGLQLPSKSSEERQMTYFMKSTMEEVEKLKSNSIPEKQMGNNYISCDGKMNFNGVAYETYPTVGENPDEFEFKLKERSVRGISRESEISTVTTSQRKTSIIKQRNVKRECKDKARNGCLTQRKRLPIDMLHRVKRKGRYIVDEDGIEDSGDDSRPRITSPCALKYRSVSPRALHMVSGKKSKL
jgi:hypothetical protein